MGAGEASVIILRRADLPARSRLRGRMNPWRLRYEEKSPPPVHGRRDRPQAENASDTARSRWPFPAAAPPLPLSGKVSACGSGGEKSKGAVNFILNHKKWMGIILGLFLCVSLLLNILSSCSILAEGLLAGMSGATYPSEAACGSGGSAVSAVRLILLFPPAGGRWRGQRYHPPPPPCRTPPRPRKRRRRNPRALSISS